MIQWASNTPFVSNQHTAPQGSGVDCSQNIEAISKSDGPARAIILKTNLTIKKPYLRKKTNRTVFSKPASKPTEF
jgi:hypothetical protein